MKPLKLGLIGVGSWGRNYIATLRDFPDARLARVATRNPEAKALVDPKCRLVEDWRKMIAAGDLDGVIITSPAPLHAEQLGAAIDAGLPALIEKPLTLDLDQARHLLEKAEQRGALVLVDHIYLYHPAFVELKRRAKALGKPKRVESSGGNTGPFRASVPPLWDYGPHDLSLCLALLGGPPKVVSAEAAARRGGEVIKVELAFPSKVRASLTFGNGFTVKERRLRVVFERGELLFDDLRDVPLREKVGKVSRPVPVDTERPMNRALDAFVAAIRSKSKDLESLRLAVDVVAALEDCGAALGRRR